MNSRIFHVCFSFLLLPVMAFAQGGPTLRDAAPKRIAIGAAVAGQDFGNPKLAALITNQFNVLTPEYEFMPEFLVDAKGEFTFARGDAVVDFAEKNQMPILGHMLVWHYVTRSWLFEDAAGKPLPREKALENLKRYIDGVMGHYKGRVETWNVVNEGLSDADGEFLRDTPARRAIGDDYIEKAFEFAHAADPDAALYYNDYNIEQPVKLEKTLKLVRALKAKNLRIDAVGIQGHFLMDWPPTAMIDKAIESLAGAGVKVMITELDVDPLPRQAGTADLNSNEKGADPYKDGLPAEMQQKLAKRYGEIVTAIVRHPSVTFLSFWGTHDGRSWLNDYPVKGRTNHPLLFDRELRPKPAFDAVIGALKAAPNLAAASPEPRFRAVEIDNKVTIGYGVAIADVDGDKRPDILLADKNVIVWYQNPTWEKRVIAEKLTALDHVCVAAADIDGDGKAEVAAGAGWNPADTVNSGSVHYLTAPADRNERWKPVTLPHEPTVHRMRWAKDEAGKYFLVVAPLHGRGNQNGQGEGVRILTYAPPADKTAPWTTNAIDETLHMTHNFEVVQWDEDAAQELLVAAREGIFLLDRDGEKWKRTKLSGDAAAAGAGEVRSGKLPGGRRFIAAIEPMHGNMVTAYPELEKADAPWPRALIDDTLREGHALACGDFLGLGYDQIIAGWRGKNKDGKTGIRLYTPLDGTGQNWRQSTIDNNMACEDLTLADLNADGKPDIIASGRATNNLKVYFGE